MTILIIGSSHKEFLRLNNYFNTLDITGIRRFMTVEEAKDDQSSFLQTEVDLIIFDVIFTQGYDEEIYQNIQLLHRWVDAPILLSTTYDKTKTIEKAFECGIFDFIPKPFSYTHFKARIQVALKYREETKLRKHREMNWQKELAIAKKVQKNALTPPLSLKHIQVDGLYVTSNTLGGDMYSWFKINDDLTAILLFDVMGHGVAASLITMSIRSLLKGMITKLIDPVFVINDLNRHIYELFSDENMDRFLVTAIYILIDTKNNTLHYVNASHPSGFLFGKYGETVMLPANTPILGLFPTTQVTKKTLKLSGWSRVILYTDGLLTLNESQTIDVNQFHSYADQDNADALQIFSENNNLLENYYSDDITVVSITITL
ncbi:SpoIIE family protein phosphatase [Solibacillus sp. FSL H8-0538]|uniref:SpoIIE family protein phosphatase n=1 Tax=Solibacillus sp. FSL H8-0538 TaxID=2921400 RepID=UPI0030FC289B